MGGDLTTAPEGKVPSFLVRAVKDPDGANLDRVQVVKGWRDSAGEMSERVYDVALSDGRAQGADGRSAGPVGDTVDVRNATYLNSIGAVELSAGGATRTSTPTRPRSTTCGCYRSQRRAGRHTTPGSINSISPRSPRNSPW